MLENYNDSLNINYDRTNNKFIIVALNYRVHLKSLFSYTNN